MRDHAGRFGKRRVRILTLSTGDDASPSGFPTVSCRLHDPSLFVLMYTSVINL